MTSKNCAYQDSNSNCLSRVRRFAGLSIPGRDTDCISCGVFICALRSLYSALKSIPLHMYIYKISIYDHKTEHYSQFSERPIPLVKMFYRLNSLLKIHVLC